MRIIRGQSSNVVGQQSVSAGTREWNHGEQPFDTWPGSRVYLLLVPPPWGSWIKAQTLVDSRHGDFPRLLTCFVFISRSLESPEPVNSSTAQAHVRVTGPSRGVRMAATERLSLIPSKRPLRSRNFMVPVYSSSARQRGYYRYGERAGLVPGKPRVCRERNELDFMDLAGRNARHGTECWLLNIE